MSVRLVVVLLSLLIAAPAMAADPAGIWAFRVGDKAIFRFEVQRTVTGWTGVWLRPEHFETDGDSFSNVRGPAVRRLAHGAREVDGDVELSFDDPRPGATPDRFRIHAFDGIRAEARYVGAWMEPFARVREAPDAAFGAWDSQRTYVTVVDRPTNAELTALFDADQKAREHWQSSDWRIIGAADRERRVRVQTLMDAGSLQSGDDFYHAAFIFQHGDAPDDYLKAHILATIAVARGKPAATWIVAATLDRYLQSIGQSQVFGTQFQTSQDGKTTQSPYSRVLLSDAMRQAMHVPPLAEQERQRQSIERDAATAK